MTTMSAEQKVLLDLVNDRVAEMQHAVKVALPGNRVLHEEFRVGAPPATTPAEAVALGRAVEPAAREYRALLLNRGLDAAQLKRFERAVADLERMVAVEPLVEAPAPVVEESGAPAKKKAGRARKKA